MNKILTRNGKNLNYQPAKVLSIPLSGMYSDVENNSVFLFALTYSRNGKTILFDVRRASDGNYVNEYHLDEDTKNYVYYKVTEESIDVYVNLLLNTKASVNCLNEGLNPTIIYYEFQNATTETLTPARILGFVNLIKNSNVVKANLEATTIKNLYATVINVSQDQQDITLDLSSFLGTTLMTGYLKVINICANKTVRYKEFIIVSGEVVDINNSSTNINVELNNDTKTITFSNLGRGGLAIQYQPVYKIN